MAGATEMLCTALDISWQDFVTILLVCHNLAGVNKGFFQVESYLTLISVWFELILIDFD